MMMIIIVSCGRANSFVRRNLIEHFTHQLDALAKAAQSDKRDIERFLWFQEKSKFQDDNTQRHPCLEKTNHFLIMIVNIFVYFFMN